MISAQEYEGFELAEPDQRTATLTGTGIDTNGMKGVGEAILHSGAASAGTNPTLDGKIQESDVLGSGYTDIPGKTFSQVTTASLLEGVSIDLDVSKRFIRFVGTLGGTLTPTFDYGVILRARK